MKPNLLRLMTFVAPASVMTLSAAEKQPNILWIITDDQRPDALECFNRATIGQSESPLGYVSSPNIDKMAEEGTLFVNTFCNSPMSCVSRASMHTGQYAFRTGRYKFSSHQETDFNHPMLSQILRDEGYGTAVFGKTHFGIASKFNAKERKEDDMFDFTVEYGRDLQNRGYGDIFTAGAKYEFIDGVIGMTSVTEQIIYPNGERKKYVVLNRDGEIPEEDQLLKSEVEEQYDILRAYTRLNSVLIMGGQSTKPAGETVDGYIVKEFCNYIDNSGKEYKTYAGKAATGADPSKPQFLNLSFHFPHTPVLPPKEYRDKFKKKKYNLPEFTTDDLSCLPDQLVMLYNECKTDQWTDEEKLQAIRDYYAFCAYGDSLIGEAVAKFKEFCAQRDEEYIIVYTVGDHSWHLGEQGINAKFGPWKQSVHNAAIVVASDKSKYPAGAVCRNFAEYVDFTPTMLAAAGVDVDCEEYDYLDGRNLANVVTEGEGESREYAIGELNVVCGHRAYMRGEEFAFSMRSRDIWDVITAPNQNKDIMWALECDRPKADMALYDLRVDPKERVNVANDYRYRELADWFRNKLGTIVLGDGRVECDWTLPNSYNISSFARGADDKRLDIPQELIPSIELAEKKQ